MIHIIRGLIAIALIATLGVAIGHIPTSAWQTALIAAAVLATAIAEIARCASRGGAR